MEDEQLEKLYKQFKFLGKRKFVELATEEGDDDDFKPVTKKQAIEFWDNKDKTNVGHQIVKSNPKKSEIYKITSIPGSYEMDIVFFVSNRPWLFIIHVPSRYVWCYNIRNKSSNSIFPIFKNWYYQEQEEQTVENERFVNTILSDQERGFVYNDVINFCADHDIRYIIKDVTEHHVLAVLDTAVRTIKRILYKILSDSDEDENTINITKLNDMIIQSVKEYNIKPHSALYYFSPVEVFYNEDLQNKFYEYDEYLNNYKIEKNKKQFNFKIGDYVRFKERKTNKIDKARYWSDKVYRIIGVFRFSYQLGDMDKDGNKIEIPKISDDRYKPYELQKVDSSSKESHNRAIFNMLKDKDKATRDAKRDSEWKALPRRVTRSMG